MAFHTAGYRPFQPAALSSAKAVAVRVQPAPVMPQVGGQLGYDSLLGRISSGISANAAELHRVDMQRTSERTQAAYRLQDLLTDMKDRVARKVSMKSPLACTEGGLELSYKAS